MRLELGRSVRCADDEFGELADIVVDPIEKRVTHLVVKSRHGVGESHLVPIALADPDAEGTGVVLTCTLQEARGLPHAEISAFLRLGEAPEVDSEWDVGVETP